jgi:hypothetical protein
MTIVRHADRISRSREKTTYFFGADRRGHRDIPDPVHGNGAERHGGITGREYSGREPPLPRILPGWLPPVTGDTGGYGGFPS